MDEKTLEKRLREDAVRLQKEFSPSLHERLKQVTAQPRKATLPWKRRLLAGALACGFLWGLVWLGGDFGQNSPEETLVSVDFQEWEPNVLEKIFSWPETTVLLADVSEISLKKWQNVSVLSEEPQYWMERLVPFSVWTVASWSLEEDLEKKECQE